MMNRRNFVAASAALTGLSGLPMTAWAEDAPAVMEMALGSEDAPVTVIEYASYTCPHCATFHANAFKKVKANYIDTGKVRFIYREAYFDRYGLWASIIARCGDGMRFFGITDILYEKQQEWARGATPQEVVASLRKIGLSAGLTNEDLDACLQDGEQAKALYEWYQANFERDKITGTPSFVINGDLHSNRSYEDFAKLLDEYLAS